MANVNPKTLGDIIQKFELQSGDITDLSSQEEINLANDKYQDICNDRQWLFLRKPATGALVLDTNGLWSIPLPADFRELCENNEYTDNTIGIDNNAAAIVVFVGENYAPFQVINYADRMQYRQHANVCYVDPQAKKIYFPQAPGDTSFYQFDYIMIPPDMTALTDEPLFPVPYRKMIAFAMAVDDDILQKTSAAQSQQQQNNGKYLSVLGDMQVWDANQQMN